MVLVVGSGGSSGEQFSTKSEVRGDEHTRLTLLQRKFFSWRLTDRPQFASDLGDYRNSDRLEEFDLELMDIRKELAEYFLDKLNNISSENLSRKDKMDYTIMKDMLESYIEGHKWSSWNYLNPMSWLEGNQRNPFFFVESTPFDTIGDFENYIARLNEMPRLFGQYRNFFNEAIRLGRTSNIRSIDRVPGQIEQILQDSVEDSIYYSPFLDFLDAYNMTLPNPNEVRKDIRRRGREAVARVFEAYRDLKDYLENVYMNHTRPSAGFGGLEGGQDFYKACLNWYLSLNMTPEEVHNLGLKEVARVKAQMHEIIEKQGYHGLSIREYFTELKKRDDMFFHTEKEIIEEYENIIYNRIEPHLDELFRDRPGLPVIVEPMPSDGSRGWYISGTSDGIRPGIFYANTFRKVPKYIMVSLAMHEANPGHHLQISYSVTADLPPFRKNSENSQKFRVPFAIPIYTAYMEGWALYAESLGVETGIFEKDYELMGYYESEIFRAARLVVDSGLHYFNMTREEAIDYFMDHTAESYEGIIIEVDRYITWPGQAAAYKVGELRIRALRQMAERELGDLFDVREFHMAVLENGAVPLKVLEENVIRWIRDFRKSRQQQIQDEDEECECVEIPRAKPKVRCRRSSPYTSTNNKNGGVRQTSGSHIGALSNYVILGLFISLLSSNWSPMASFRMVFICR
ncbi:myosin essential light chain [Plakobranchus ocellatus]|uniref:Myosin essential light chain n=1 Tax=Plakobranchus ocellatus TaxID=259542 RepID=A0AAV3Z435_9GAST|nr:myosin essential light chain [Plakobranchus ocellatus]